MRNLILDITPDLHAQRVRKIHGSLNRASKTITTIVISTVALWLGIALGLIPLFDRKVDIPAFVRSAMGKLETPVPGATGFMVDSTHFLTTLTALTGGTGDVKQGSPVEVVFSSASGKAEPPVKGTVHWKSADLEGTKLVLVKMAAPRNEFIQFSDKEIADGKRIALLGYTTTAAGESELTGKPFKLASEGGVISVQWGDQQAPAYEGFAILDGEDFRLQGILTGGSSVIKIPVDDLIKAGVVP
jgi:hypothetical protein